ncbi:hypothetical protein BKA62DRAFT_730956 [Auriculariales sp. MPI-PUGE-AT-0066]|nr:hypothetical protein BKA62DRAFT_730956 [Auriculariales sp. MPI-PUGE-AT-0066]
MTFDRLPQGSWVLVTGATGLVGSVVVELLLEKGFRVRGVGRSATRAAQFTEHLKAKYGVSSYEFAEVQDFTVSEAFDVALQGVAGVLHIATETNFDILGSDTDGALIAASAAVLGLMKAAARTNTVKSFVLTSSSITAMGTAMLQYGPDAQFSTENWEDDLIPMAKSLSSDAGFAKSGITYAATKVYAEREAWKFWNETKPGYAFNTVLPVTILGPVANPTKGAIYSTHTWLNELFLGDRDGIIMKFMNPAKAMVDSRDCAVIHVAALLSTEVDGQRLWASAHLFTANQILAVWRKAFPDRAIGPDFDFPAHPKTEITDLDKSTKLLEEFTGKGWYSLEECVIANVASVL